MLGRLTSFRCAALVVMLATSAALVLPPVSSAAPSLYELAEYLVLAESYRSGSRSLARGRIERWPPERLRAAITALPRFEDHLRQKAGHDDEIEVGTIEAAALMHAEVGLLALERERGRDAERHLSAASHLVAWLADAAKKRDARRRKGKIAPRLEPRCTPADLNLALARALLAAGFPLDAAEFAKQARKLAPQDARVLEIAGAIAETEALDADVRNRDKDARRHRERAEAALRAAIAADPGLVEARLRLGHLLLAQGRAQEAEAVLREVVARASDARQTYLASLFLGRALESRQQPAEASEAYRRALDAWPDNQAARLALGRVLELRFGLAEARDLVEASLNDSLRHDRAPDPWWSYPYGDRDAAKQGLAMLWERVLGP